MVKAAHQARLSYLQDNQQTMSDILGQDCQDNALSAHYPIRGNFAASYSQNEAGLNVLRGMDDEANAMKLSQAQENQIMDYNQEGSVWKETLQDFAEQLCFINY